MSLVIVTGGADGIGLGAALKYAEQGATVLVADRDEEKVNQVRAEHNLEGIVCDVSSDADLDKLKEAAADLGSVDVVMANAGVAIGGRFESVPLEEWQRLFDVNVFGVVRTIQAFLPGFQEAGSGRFIITGSSAGIFGSDGFNTPYAASKHALLGLAKGLAVYCESQGIGVHYLAPRLTDTAFPRSSVAWGRKGSRVTDNRDIGDDFDTVDDVIAALFQGIEREEFLISLDAQTKERLMAFAENPSASF